MEAKTTQSQARSEYSLAPEEISKTIGVRPVLEVSESGVSPATDLGLFHTFTYTGQDSLEVLVLRKVFFFTEKEVGRRKIKFSELRQSSGRWELISPQGEVAGTISLSFEVDKRWLSMDGLTTHASVNSCSDLFDSQPCLSDCRNNSCLILNNQHELEQVSFGLSQEHCRLRGQQHSLEVWATKLKNESMTLQCHRTKVSERKTVVAKRAQEINAAWAQLKEERLRLLEEWEAAQQDKKDLEQQFMRLKVDKLKTRLHLRLGKTTKAKITKQINKAKQVQNRTAQV